MTIQNDIANLIDIASVDLHAYDDASAERKEQFHACGKRVLREIAKRLGVVRPKAISNYGGIAVGGEVRIETPELWIEFASGVSHLGILYRRGRDGANRWEPWTSLANLDTFVAKLQSVAKEPYRKF